MMGKCTLFFTDKSGDSLEFINIGTEDKVAIISTSKMFPSVVVTHVFSKSQIIYIIDFLQEQLNDHTTKQP